MKNKSLLVGLLICVPLLLMATVGPWFAGDPLAQDLAGEFAAPSRAHPFGQGDNGIDLLAQIVAGARVSLGISLAVASISAGVGLLLGSVAGYFGGRADLLLTAAMNVTTAFPGIILVVALASLLGPSFRNVVLALLATSWVSYARIARIVAASTAEKEFVAAAKALGLPSWRVLTRHVWPALYPSLLVQMCFGLGSVILTESSLSFLGLGLPPGTPSWGQLLQQGRDAMTSAPHSLVIPSTILVGSVIGFHFMGDGLREAWDPQRRQKAGGRSWILGDS